MDNKYGIEVPPINDYFNNGDWTCKSKEIPIELQDKVNKLFDFIFEKYPDQVVIGLKKLSQGKHKNSTDLMKEMGFDDLKEFFNDFGFYYDYDGTLAFRLYNEGVKVEAKEEEEINIEPIGPAAIPFEDVCVNSTFKSIRDGEFIDPDSPLNVFLNKILEKYPNRMIYKFSNKYRKLSEKMPGLRKQYVYEDNFSLFADFGFTYISNYSETNKYNWLEQHFKETDLDFYFKPFSADDTPATELGREFYIDDDLYDKLKMAMEPFNVDLDTYLEYKLLSVTVKFSFKANDLTDKLTNGKVLKPDFVRSISSNLNKNEIDNYNLYLLKRVNKADDINEIKRIMSLYAYLNIEIDYRSLAVASLITYFSSYSDDYIGLFNYANNKTLEGTHLRLDTKILEGNGFEITEFDPSYYYLMSIGRNLSNAELLEAEAIYKQIKGYKDIDKIYKSIFTNISGYIAHPNYNPEDLKAISLEDICEAVPVSNDGYMLRVKESVNAIYDSLLIIDDEFMGKRIIALDESLFFKGKFSIAKINLSKGIQYINSIRSLNPFSELNELKEIEVDSGNEYYSTDNNFLVELTPYGKRAIKYFGCEKNVRVPKVMEIGAYCFKGTRAKELTFDSENEALDNFALADSLIDTLNNAEIIKRIGGYAFKGSKLKSFKLNPQIEYIDEYALRDSNISIEGGISNNKNYFISENVLYNTSNGYVPVLILKRHKGSRLIDKTTEINMSFFDFDRNNYYDLSKYIPINGLEGDINGWDGYINFSNSSDNKYFKASKIYEALTTHAYSDVNDTRRNPLRLNGYELERLIRTDDKLGKEESLLAPRFKILFDAEICIKNLSQSCYDNVSILKDELEKLEHNSTITEHEMSFDNNLALFNKLLKRYGTLQHFIEVEAHVSSNQSNYLEACNDFIRFKYTLIEPNYDSILGNKIIKIKVEANTSAILLFSNIKDMFNFMDGKINYLLTGNIVDEYIYIFNDVKKMPIDRSDL